MLANTTLCPTEDQIYVLESQEGNLQKEMPISLLGKSQSAS
jgi:hypothetical protein